MSELRAAAQAWAALDPDPQTRAQTEAMLGDADQLEIYFRSALQFGTAGMRGPLGPGPGGMNRANVRRVTAGLARYLNETVPSAREQGVVIGFDGRHGSREFAEDSARVLGDAGIPSFLYDEVVPTPQLGHAVLFLKTAAGIMVTASHNPPQDNGYKVYWSNGAQIVEPHDAGISAMIEALPPKSVGELKAKPVPPAALDAYLTQVDAVRVWDGDTNVSLVYTAMHGVGRKLVETVLDRHGYTDRHLVTSQVDPDPDFPTVAFPNPEEPGALDLALALAAEVKADVVFANDPDADRLSASVLDGERYRTLTGNQVGVLLADELLTHGPKGQRMVATTVVSSAQLAKIAKRHGADYRETLTGFKWIANAAITYEADGGRFVMGFEEALGYSVGDVVRDKDGVSALLVFCDLVARCKADGVSVMDRLTALYRRDGLHASQQHSIKLPGAEGAARIQATMAALRSDPPVMISQSKVIDSRDYLLTEETGLPKSNVLAFYLDDGSRILARPSGTEPKIKFYFEVCQPLPDGTSLAEGEAAANARLEELTRVLVATAFPGGI